MTECGPVGIGRWRVAIAGPFREYSS